MPVRKFTCPECEAVLRPAKPLPSGKRVTGPKCVAGFVVRGDAEEDEVAGKAKKPSTPAGKAKDNPFGDDGPEMYAVIKEEEPAQEEDEDEEEDDDYDDDEDRPRKKKPKKDTARMEDLEFRL